MLRCHAQDSCSSACCEAGVHLYGRRRRAVCAAREGGALPASQVAWAFESCAPLIQGEPH